MIRTITPILSILAALLIFFFFTKPEFAEVKRVRMEADRYQSAIETAELRNKELEAKITEKQGHPAVDIERLNTLVPSEIDEVKILADLSELARKHNVLFGNVSVMNNDMKPQSAVADGSQKGNFRDLIATDLQFGLIGTYDQFKAFLADIESSLMLHEITNISFQATEGILEQYGVTVRVYALPPQKE